MECFYSVANTRFCDVQINVTIDLFNNVVVFKF